MEWMDGCIGWMGWMGWMDGCDGMGWDGTDWMGWMDGRACVALRGRACASGRVLSCVCACSCVRGRAFGRARTRGVCVCVCVRAWSRARARVQCVRAWEDDHTHTHAPPTTVDATRQFCAPQVIAEDHRGRSCGRMLRARGAARAAARDWRRHRGLKKTLSSSSSAIVCATSDHARTTSHARQRTTTHTRPRFHQQGSPGRPRLPQTGCREHIGHLVTIIGLPMTASIGTGRFRRSAPSSPEHET